MKRGSHYFRKKILEKSFKERTLAELDMEQKEIKKLEREFKAGGKVILKAEIDSRGRRIIDRLVLFIAFLAPLVEIPQLIKIYMDKSAADVSLITWGLFVVFGFPWLVYGMIHKEKPVVILYSLWIIIDSIIVIGILMYR